MATLSTSFPAPLARSADQRTIPPLQSGDRLTHSQFMERYDAMPPQIKAERIEGIVYMAAAALSAEFHGQPHVDIITWLGVYRAATLGVIGADNSTTTLDTDNDPQPDVSLRILSSHGGRAKLSPEGYVLGAPEMIVEIAASSFSYDLGAKMNAYRRNGVNEYLVYRAYDGESDWFVLRDGQYHKLPADNEGVYRSEIFPGLWLKADAFIAGNLAEVLTVLQRGIAANEHGEFVKRLESQRIAGHK